jgi:hypothetical protein
MTLFTAGVALTLIVSGFPITPTTWPVAFPYDDGSWQKPLQEKAAIFEDMIEKNHNIDGLYPSQVTLIDGEVNLSTSGHADVSHSLNWTTALFVGEVYRWKHTGDPAARERAVELFYAIDRCQRVNGVPGVISRGYVYGHGPSYEERRGHGRGQERWFQGEGEYSGYRWRGSPSHHNHSGFYRAMGLAWLAFEDDEAIRERVKENVRVVTERVFYENNMVVRDWDGVVSAELLDPDYDGPPDTSAFFVTSELKVASVILDDPRATDLYNQWVDKLKYREYANRPPADIAANIHKDYDDAEHCFQHLDTMMQMEEDEELLRFYKNFAEALWIQHKDDKQPFYNVMYHAVTGNDPKAEDVVWWLKYYPTNKVFQPRMANIRPDIDQVKKPLPINERPFDNEYDFKGDPYRLEGWGARYITGVGAAAIDPNVMYACDDAGYLYRSLDGGQTWANSFQGLNGAFVNSVLPSPEEVEVVLVATDRGVLRSKDAGWSWTHMVGDKATVLVADPGNKGIAYAVTDDGIYRSTPFDSESWGYTWTKAGGEGPPLPVTTYFAVRQGDSVAFLAQDERNTIWKSGPDAEQWQLLERPFGGRYAFSVIRGSGSNMVALAPDAKAVAVSTQGGAEWEPVGRQIYWYGEPGPLSEVDIQAVMLDPKDPSVVYIGSEKGLWVSRDAGATFEQAQQGIDIPAIGALMACPVTGRVFAGTRSGLYWTDDQGATWVRGNLVPQFEGIQLIETGPADYIEAYWLARYHGVISDEQVEAAWTDPE